MKATITIATAKKEFNEDQMKIIKRVAMVLYEHDLSVDVKMKKVVKKNIKLQIKRVS
jgi:hypothetical protein